MGHQNSSSNQTDYNLVAPIRYPALFLTAFTHFVLQTNGLDLQAAGDGLQGAQVQGEGRAETRQQGEAAPGRNDCICVQGVDDIGIKIDFCHFKSVNVLWLFVSWGRVVSITLLLLNYLPFNNLLMPQVFWTKRLSSLNTVNVAEAELDRVSLTLPASLKPVGPDISDHMLLASISTHLHISKDPATGQQSSQATIDKNPAAFINPNQPLMSKLAGIQLHWHCNVLYWALLRSGGGGNSGAGGAGEGGAAEAGAGGQGARLSDAVKFTISGRVSSLTGRDIDSRRMLNVKFIVLNNKLFNVAGPG